MKLILHFPRSSKKHVVNSDHEAVAGTSDTCDILLSDYLHGSAINTISRQHCKFLYVAGSGFAVVDLDSTNGTKVNGLRLSPGAPRFLRDDDMITFANNMRLALRIEIDQGDYDENLTEPVRPTKPTQSTTATRIQQGTLQFMPKTGEFVISGRRLPRKYLTKQQEELLKFLYEHSHQVCTREDLLENVWGYERYESTEYGTVDRAISGLRKKLDDVVPDIGKKLIRTVHGRGYKCETDIDEHLT